MRAPDSLGWVTVDMQPARAAAAQGRWGAAYELFGKVDTTQLAPEDVELFAECAWWRSQVPQEIDLRQRAFTGFVAVGNVRRAAYAAWMLSVRHGLRGEPAASSGWLKRAQRLLTGEPEGAEHGYVACSETEQALRRGDLAQAEEHAVRAVGIGHRFDDPDLTTLAVAWHGQCLLARDEIDEGTRLLDEAMTRVVAGELSAHFTGWVYCFAIGMCMGVADLARAGAWARSAWDWASSLRDDTPYRGLCRVRLVEVMSLRGELETAENEARQACEEMLAFEPHLAGEAFYLTGEILRRKGEPAAAERAFAEARELGHDPQPGLARIRLAEGRLEAAAVSLRASLSGGGHPPFQRAALLAAQVEVAVAEGDLETATRASDALDEIAARLPSDAVVAAATTARGRVHLAAGRADAALAELRPAAASWRSLGLACEAAEARTLIGLALRELGDTEGAEQELTAAYRAFQRACASGDAQRVAGLRTAGRPPAGLTSRECEVLRLVAAGRTNREIAAELVVSEHTVARHMSKIFTKLGVSSRTAAAAFAFAHELA